MKMILNRVFLVLTPLLILFGCKDMDETYRDYIVANGMVYPAKVENPLVNSGNGRIQISWPRGSDPNVKSAGIYWNNYSDSVKFPVPADVDTVRRIISGLHEASYSFIIKTFDDKGNVSVPVEVNGTVYGETYESYLNNRGIVSDLLEMGDLVIRWSDPDITNGMIKTVIRYRNLDGDSAQVEVDAAQNSLIIDDYDPVTFNYSYQTFFLPDSSSMDTFFVAFETKRPLIKFDRTDWVTSADQFEPNAQLPSGPSFNAIDDDVNTYWHTNHTEVITGYPHWFAVDMKAARVIKGFEMVSRLAYFTENFTEFILQGSLDGVNWDDIATYTLAQTPDTQLFTVNGEPSFRHLRVYMTKGITPHAYLAEFAVMGY